jgi:TRAP-type C4-dicarboxylate transport system permease small subunit
VYASPGTPPSGPGGDVGTPPGGSGQQNLNLDLHLQNPLSVNTLQEFIKRFLEVVLTIAIPVIALFIIYAGFLFVSARGNPAQLTKAKNTLLYTVIGAAILLGAWVLASAVAETVNQVIN